MAENFYLNAVRFEQTLRPGQPVEVHWTFSGMPYEGAAHIVAINDKSVRASLDHEVTNYLAGSGGWPGGTTITVPRATASKRWSRDNGVFPPRLFDRGRGRRATMAQRRRGLR